MRTKIRKKIGEKIKELEDIKESLAKEVLASKLPKEEQLDIITNNSLWGIASWVQPIFIEWEQECIDLERATAIADGKIEGKDYFCSIVDDFVNNNGMYSKHETIYFTSIINQLYDLENDEEKNLGKFEVITCRGDYKSKIFKTKEEIIDCVYDFAVKNKIIGYELDW